jgi:hypothetical protein
MELFKILAFYIESVCHLIKVVFVRLDALLERYSSSSKDSISDLKKKEGMKISTQILLIPLKLQHELKS